MTAITPADDFYLHTLHDQLYGDNNETEIQKIEDQLEEDQPDNEPNVPLIQPYVPNDPNDNGNDNGNNNNPEKEKHFTQSWWFITIMVVLGLFVLSQIFACLFNQRYCIISYLLLNKTFSGTSPAVFRDNPDA